MILEHFDADILCITETHLEEGANISINGYTFFLNSRSSRHIQSVKPSGGVAIGIKTNLLRMYDVSVEDNSHDGILALVLKHKVSGLTFLVKCTYIAPERSIWGRNSLMFFTHLLNLTYEYSDIDCTVVCGDVNSRIGDLKDYVPNIDNICDRMCVDKTPAGHYKDFIEFLIESKFCVVNGRVCNENDTYTSISKKGSAVVDYFCVPHDQLVNCSYFKVHTITEIINNLGIQGDCLPDHSPIELHYKPHIMLSPTYIPPKVLLESVNNMKNQRYNVKCIPDDFLCSEVSQNRIAVVLNNLVCETGTNIDSTYQDIVDIYQTEMDNKLRKCKMDHQLKHCHRFKPKPFWNPNLQLLWTDVQNSEKQYLQAPHSNLRKIKLSLYKNSRHTFDKAYKKEKRKYNRQKQNQIETANCNNPQEFWKYINRLGPKKTKTVIPMEVCIAKNGDKYITRDCDIVYKVWIDYFKNLYHVEPQETEISLTVSRDLKLLENNLDFNENSIFNIDITILEVQNLIIFLMKFLKMKLL